MSKENKFLAINTSIALILGLAFLLAFNMFYPQSKYPEYQNLFPTASSIESIDFDSFGLVYDRLEVKKGDEVLGYIYKGKGTNQHTGTGFIDIQIGISIDNVITGIDFIELTQTDWAVPTVRENAAFFKNKSLDDITLAELANFESSYDVTSGATRGSNTVRSIIREAIMIHTGGLDVSEYADLFPTADQIVPVALSGNKLVYQKLEVRENDQVIGYIYQGKDRNLHSKPGEYIDIKVGITTNDVVTGLSFIEIGQDDFKHNTILTNSAVYKDKPLSEINLDELLIVLSSENPYDAQTGATKGTYVVRTILAEAIRLHKNITASTDLVKAIFPNYSETNSEMDNTFVANQNVLSRMIVRDSNNQVIGYLYELFGENEVGAGEHYEDADMKLLVGLNQAETRVIKIMIPQADFNQTSSYYSDSIKYVNLFTALEVSRIGTIGFNYSGTDMTTGASQTPTLIRVLLDSLVEVLA